MNKSLGLLVALVLIVGCASPGRRALDSADSYVKAAQREMATWSKFVATNHPPSAVEMRVAVKYNMVKTRKDDVSIKALEYSKQNVNLEALQLAVTMLGNAKNELRDLIAFYMYKWKPAPVPPIPTTNQ